MLTRRRCTCLQSDVDIGARPRNGERAAGCLVALRRDFVVVIALRQAVFARHPLAGGNGLALLIFQRDRRIAAFQQHRRLHIQQNHIEPVRHLGRDDLALPALLLRHREAPLQGLVKRRGNRVAVFAGVQRPDALFIGRHALASGVAYRHGRIRGKVRRRHIEANTAHIAHPAHDDLHRVLSLCVVVRRVIDGKFARLFKVVVRRDGIAIFAVFRQEAAVCLLIQALAAGRCHADAGVFYLLTRRIHNLEHRFIIRAV